VREGEGGSLEGFNPLRNPKMPSLLYPTMPHLFYTGKDEVTGVQRTFKEPKLIHNFFTLCACLIYFRNTNATSCFEVQKLKSSFQVTPRVYLKGKHWAS